MEAQAAHLFLIDLLGLAQMRYVSLKFYALVKFIKLYHSYEKCCNDGLDLGSCIIFINIHEYTN